MQVPFTQGKQLPPLPSQIVVFKLTIDLSIMIYHNEQQQQPKILMDSEVYYSSVIIRLMLCSVSWNVPPITAQWQQQQLSNVGLPALFALPSWLWPWNKDESQQSRQHRRKKWGTTARLWQCSCFSWFVSPLVFLSRKTLCIRNQKYSEKQNKEKGNNTKGWERCIW